MATANKQIGTTRFQKIPAQLTEIKNACLANKRFTIVLVMAFVVSGFYGLLLALGYYSLVIVLTLAIFALLLLVYPKIGLWLTIIGTLVVSGLVDLYVPYYRPLKWVLPIIAIGLAFEAKIIAVMKGNKLAMQKPNKQAQMVKLWSGLFFVSALFSLLINWQGVSALAVGLKGYFQVWGLLIAIYYLFKDEQDAARLMRFLLLLALLQLPFVLHQFLFLVPKRSGYVAAIHHVVAVDVVSGTFGGSMSGGGRSTSLALLITIAFTMLLAYYRTNQMSARRTLCLSAIALFPLLLNEAKIIVVIFPIALFLLFRDQILRNPLKSLLWTIVFIMSIMATISVYLMLPGAKMQQQRGLEDMFRETVDYNLGNRGYGEVYLNRSTVYSFWLKEHMNAEGIIPVLIGHGPGATNTDSLVMHDSLANKRYKGFGIGVTGLAALLWEVGLLGVITVLLLFLSAYRLGGTLSQQWIGTPHWPLIKAAQISMLLFLINLLHNNFFVFDLSYQGLLILVLSYLLVMSRFANPVTKEKIMTTNKLVLRNRGILN